MELHWSIAPVLVITSVLAALIALGLLSLLTRQQRAGTANIFDTPEDAVVFLFDDTTLVDATEPARRLLAGTPPGPTPWSRLSTYLLERFPEAPGALAELARRGKVNLAASADEPVLLEAEWCNGLARVTLVDTAAEGTNVLLDRLSHRATEDELAQLRALAQHAPMPVWRESAQGSVVWANHAYLRLAAARDVEAEVLTWPLPRLFGDIERTTGPTDPLRLSLRMPDTARPRWFDCHRIADDTGHLNFALPVDGQVQAEAALEAFVQTLTRTFADLPIGLAVFDRQRRLQVFNPALDDLTSLGPTFLSSQPTLETFLDRLREARILPEPKDYRSWRRRLTEVEKAALSGHYLETWSLPGGQTLRVSGRPHPDGAIGLLFQDITDEVSLTRNFRTELETGQAVLDSLSEAMAVFSSAGVLVMSNAAYAALWGIEPECAVAEFGVGEAMRHWQARTEPGADWSGLQARIGSGADRGTNWEGEATLLNGRCITMRATALAGRATLVTFSDRADGGRKSGPRPSARQKDTREGLGELRDGDSESTGATVRITA